MNDSVLAKFGAGRAGDVGAPGESDGTEDLGCFGWLRGVRDRALMLEVRHRDGNVSGFGYAWLDRLEFDPSEGITLHFSGKSVKMIGRNLNAELRANVRLVAGILRHRVPWIQEADEATGLSTPRGEPVIERLEIKL
jgi:hypothetical protein